jgi:uncharacterized protein YutE (UPF0331/DUF86 family)
VDFESYLESTRRIAKTEKEILDEIARMDDPGPIGIRAAKSSLQTLIENAIGKSRRILKHYDCPTVPRSGRDAVIFLYETGVIDEETYRELSSAIGFRNAMIHEYMDFDETILLEILRKRRYEKIYEFLMRDVKLDDIRRHRIETYYL